MIRLWAIEEVALHHIDAEIAQHVEAFPRFRQIRLPSACPCCVPSKPCRERKSGCRYPWAVAYEYPVYFQDVGFQVLAR